MRRVITAATVAVALVVLGHGHTVGTHTAARTPAPTAPATTPHPSSTTSPSTTTAHHPATGKAAALTKTTVHPAVTTTTSNALEVAVVRQRALQTCLEQASANKFRTIAANNAWYQQQVRRIATRGQKAGALLQVLLAQESQTRDLIDAQLTIDESNCYIKYA